MVAATARQHARSCIPVLARAPRSRAGHCVPGSGSDLLSAPSVCLRAGSECLLRHFSGLTTARSKLRGQKREAASSFCPFAPVESFLVAKDSIGERWGCWDTIDPRGDWTLRAALSGSCDISKVVSASCDQQSGASIPDRRRNQPAEPQCGRPGAWRPGRPKPSESRLRTGGMYRGARRLGASCQASHTCRPLKPFQWFNLDQHRRSCCHSTKGRCHASLTGAAATAQVGTGVIRVADLTLSRVLASTAVPTASVCGKSA